jgi:hypothetical protein
MRFYLYVLIAVLIGAIPGFFIPGYWSGYVLFLLQVWFLWVAFIFLTPEHRNTSLALLSLATFFWIAYLAWPTPKPSPATKPTEGPEVLIGPELVPEAMRACAEAFVRYGFWDVRDYECRLERGSEGVVVALYGPEADEKATGEKKRLGEVPIGFGGGE